MKIPPALTLLLKPTARLLRRFTGAMGILALLFSSLLPGARGGTVDLPGYGFEIEALDAQAGKEPITALMMFLPATDGFGPNINVNIQPYNGSVKDYAKLSTGQFEQMKWKVITGEVIGENEWRVEYTGALKAGEQLHFYARALAKDGHVYLVTATAKESQWAAVGAKLRKHVDSMKLK